VIDCRWLVTIAGSSGCGVVAVGLFAATRLECAAPISDFNRKSNGIEKLENLKVQKLEIKLRAVMLRASCLRMRRDANS